MIYRPVQTVSALAMHFERLVSRNESSGVKLAGNSLHNGGGSTLFDTVASIADEQKKLVEMFHIAAANECIQAFYPVHKTLLAEEIEGSINRGRFSGRIVDLQLLQQIVGLDGLMIAPDQFQHESPDSGETGAAFHTKTLGAAQRAVNASPMIVSVPLYHHGESKSVGQVTDTRGTRSSM